MRAWAIRWGVAVTALCIALSSCTSADDPGHNGPGEAATFATAKVDPDASMSVTFGDIRISAGVGAFTTEGTLSLSTGPTPPVGSPQLGRLRAATETIKVDVEGTAMAGRATITRVVPASWKKSWVPVMVWEDGTGGWQWLPTRQRVDTETGLRTAVARTGHFSNGFLGAFDPRSAANKVFSDLGNLITGRSGVAAPHCDAEDEVRTRLTVRSDSGDAVKWCLGMQGDRPVLKVANNRRTFAQVSTPLGSQVVSGAGYGISVSSLVRVVGEGLSRFAEAFPEDRNIILLGPGKTVTITVPSTARGGVQVEGSVPGYLLSILVNAVDVYAGVAKAAGLKATTNGERILTLLGDGAGKGSDWADATMSCLREFTDEFTDDFAAPISGVDELSRVAKFAGICGAAIGAASIEASGVLAWVVSATAAAVASILATVYSLVEQLFAGTREIFDEVAYAFGSPNDPVYGIVTQPRLDRTLYGTTWSVHGGGLVIGSDGTATSMGHGSCPGETFDTLEMSHWCNDVMEFSVQPMVDGLRLTVTRTYTDDVDTGERLPASKYAVRLGSYYIVKRYHDGYLITQLYSPSGRHLYAGSANNLGNPYLCEVGSDNSENLCGA